MRAVDSAVCRCFGFPFAPADGIVFDEQEVADTVLKALCTKKGVSFESLGSFDAKAYKERQYDLLADAVRAGLDMPLIYRILNREV